MSSIWSSNIKLSLFGESHGTCVGVTIDGLPPGVVFNFAEIQTELNRRKPGNTCLTTQRSESDEFEILSGYFNDYTTGTPLTVIFKNHDTKSKDYSRLKEEFRPSHADFTGYVKYQGFHDFRGGGHFSARVTAPLVFTGAIAKQLLKIKGIEVCSRIKSIADISDIALSYTEDHRELLRNIQSKIILMVDGMSEELAKLKIEEMRNSGDSVGGKVECFIYGMPAGIGNPFFNSIESQLGSLLFSIPGVKGVEFGKGFEISKLRGTAANDIFYSEKDEIKTRTNHSGGIQGGISNGMPINLVVAFKPTASIFTEQESVNCHGEKIKLQLQGRHDPCIVLRAAVIVEAICAIGILDFML
ncbi:MAG: chorismate synthase [Fusobacteria bacterium]|nr:chorismate synthase [Fusobacteriota bacterium]